MPVPTRIATAGIHFNIRKMYIVFFIFLTSYVMISKTISDNVTGLMYSSVSGKENYE